MTNHQPQPQQPQQPEKKPWYKRTWFIILAIIVLIIILAASCSNEDGKDTGNTAAEPETTEQQEGITPEQHDEAEQWVNDNINEWMQGYNIDGAGDDVKARAMHALDHIELSDDADTIDVLLDVNDAHPEVHDMLNAAAEQVGLWTANASGHPEVLLDTLSVVEAHTVSGESVGKNAHMSSFPMWKKAVEERD